VELLSGVVISKYKLHKGNNTYGNGVLMVYIKYIDVIYINIYIIYVKIDVLYIYLLLLKCGCYSGNHVVINMAIEIVEINMFKMDIIMLL
jgi:hypothetical protein